MLHLDFDRIHARAGVKDLIKPLRRAMAVPAMIPKRNHYDLDGEGRTLLIMPAWLPGTSVGVKVSTVFLENPQQGLHSVNGSYLLLSASTGVPRALLDGRALTLLRTAAISALAAELLAPKDADVLLMVGTGALAKYLIEGHLAVRSYKSVLIWGRNPTRAAEVAKQCVSLDCSVELATDLERAVRSADVISCATSSKQALIKGEWLKARCHLDLVGSFRAEMRETDQDCFRHAAVTVDTMDAVYESGDLIGPLKAGVLQRSRIHTLQEVIGRAGKNQRTPQTVFKSVGVASADLAAAEHIISSGVG